MLDRRGVPVTRRALLQRINRRLKEDQQVVKAARGDHAQQDVGEFYRLDYARNAVVEQHVDLEALGRKLKVLAPFERLRVREGGIL